MAAEWRGWERYGVAAVSVVVGALARLTMLSSMGTRVVWLTFYPAITLAALLGGLPAGVAATALSCLVATFLWQLFGHEPFIRDSVDVTGMLVFVLNGVIIATVAEAMLRARQAATRAMHEAEAASRAKSMFLAHMSHELRTPLNAILGFSGLLRDDAGLAGEHRRTLELINRSGEHLLVLINDVLDMSKIEAGRVVVALAPCDLRALLADVVAMMTQRASAKALSLTLTVDDGVPEFVVTDGSKLWQVLVNLLGNAVKFTEHGGVRVEVRNRVATDRSGARTVIAVIDSGIGIHPDDQARIFEPFVQVAQAATHKGTGLGLAISRQFVELLGGTLTVESAVGRGSTFEASLDVAVAHAVPEDALIANVRSVIPASRRRDDLRVLIVDDSQENALLLTRILARIGIDAQVAESGTNAIAAFQSYRPRLIWMDVRMAVMDGLEATRQIRALDGGKDVVIVGLTASVFTEQRADVLEAGMDDFLRKPYQPREIYELLERYLGLTLAWAAEPASADTSGQHVPPVDALAALPAGLRREIEAAVVSLDGPRMERQSRRLADVDLSVSEWLLERTTRLEYTEVLQALHHADALAEASS